MKKILLPLVAAATCMSAGAAEATFNFADPASLTPAVTVPLEEHVSGSTTQYYTDITAKNFTAGDVTFRADTTKSASAQPRLWQGTKAIDFRIYKTQSMTFSLPKGAISAITFNVTGTDFANPTVNYGTFTNAANGVASWAGSANNLVISLADDSKTVKITSIVVTYDLNATPGDEPAPNPPTPGTTEEKMLKFAKASEIKAGETYILVSPELKIGKVIDESSSYGRLNLVDATAEGAELITSSLNGISVEADGANYRLKDAYGRYLSMDSTHLSTFQLYKEATPGSSWTVALADGNATITNCLNTGYVVAQGYNSEKVAYTNLAPTAADAEKVLPMLYVCTGEAGQAPAPAIQDLTFAKVTEIKDGAKYIFVNEKGKVGKCIAEGDSYGRLSLVDPVSSVDGRVVTPETNAVTIKAVEGGYTILDYYGRYLSMDASHFTSFQLYKDVQDGSKWIASFVENGAVEFSNVMNEGCRFGQAFVNDSTEEVYTNIAPSAAGARVLLPYLYEQASTEILSLEADAIAPVEYFNLQGIRVTEPKHGIFIRKEGNKTTKVIK